MKKIKLYSIISVLITVILFGTAAFCVQCGNPEPKHINPPYPTAATDVSVITQAPEITEEDEEFLIDLQEKAQR